MNLGKAGVKVSRICLGAMTYGSKKWREWVLEEEESRPFIQRALELGINFFDTADMYSVGRQRGDSRPRAEGFRPLPRPRGDRHQGVQSHGRRSQPARPLAQAHPARHRRQPAAPGHRLRGPLPDSSPRLRNAHRRDAGRSGRRGERGQGAIHRCVVDVRLAVRQDAAYRPTRWASRASSPCRITTT